jgi:Holliday junction resolvasome RuvABC endonuclease subunit
VRILAIDPGTTHCGWAVTRASIIFASGVIDPRKIPLVCGCGVEAANVARGGSACSVCGNRLPRRSKASRAQALVQLRRELDKVIALHQPTVVLCESAHLGAHASAVIGVSEARGVVSAAASVRGLEMVSMTPGEHKKTTTGHGHASKDATRAAVNGSLPRASSKVVASYDEADACSIAWWGLKVWAPSQVRAAKAEQTEYDEHIRSAREAGFDVDGGADFTGRKRS